MRRAWSRLQAMLRRLLGGGASDKELNEELRAFVEHDADSKIRSGMTPEVARRAALIELGGAEQVKEDVREARAGARVDGIVRDIRYAMRSLGRSPGFSFSVIGNLSLGLAATIAAFAFINGAMLRPFPGVRDQDRLVEVGILANTPFGIPRPSRTAWADYPDVVRALGEGMTSLDGLASFTDSDVAVTLPQPRSLPAAFVSPNPRPGPAPTGVAGVDVVPLGGSAALLAAAMLLASILPAWRAARLDPMFVLREE